MTMGSFLKESAIPRSGTAVHRTREDEQPEKLIGIQSLTRLDHTEPRSDRLWREYAYARR